jgi:hypothetical protein
MVLVVACRVAWKSCLACLFGEIRIRAVAADAPPNPCGMVMCELLGQSGAGTIRRSTNVGPHSVG